MWRIITLNDKYQLLEILEIAGVQTIYIISDVYTPNKAAYCIVEPKAYSYIHNHVKDMCRYMDKDTVKAAATKEHQEEVFKEQVQNYKQRLKWPLWKRLFPWRIQLKVTDLRK